MGGLGSHHIHPYALQAAAFFVSLILPALVFVVLGGAFIEHRRRNGPARASTQPDGARPFAFSRD